MGCVNTVCWWFGVWDPEGESCIQQRNIACVRQSIEISNNKNVIPVLNNYHKILAACYTAEDVYIAKLMNISINFIITIWSLGIDE